VPFFLLLLLTLLIGSAAYAANSGAPWVPTKKKDIQRFLDFVEMKPGENFYELGCGDARLSLAAVKKYGVKAVGVELSIIQAIAAYLRARLSKTKLKIKWANLFKIDLSDADLVYLFLMPETYAKIKPKLEKELKPGARVVTYVWPIVGWKPIKVDEVEKGLKLYLYRF
jgi:SAM-dependent methyltransferase